jgi:hypothetical protein
MLKDVLETVRPIKFTKALLLDDAFCEVAIDSG